MGFLLVQTEARNENADIAVDKSWHCMYHTRLVVGAFGTEDRYYQVFSRLKEDLRCMGVDADPLIENKTFKQCCFSLPPENIPWDEEQIRVNAGELAAALQNGKRI